MRARTPGDLLLTVFAWGLPPRRLHPDQPLDNKKLVRCVTKDCEGEIPERFPTTVSQRRMKVILERASASALSRGETIGPTLSSPLGSPSSDPWISSWKTLGLTAWAAGNRVSGQPWRLVATVSRPRVGRDPKVSGWRGNPQDAPRAGGFKGFFLFMSLNPPSCGLQHQPVTSWAKGPELICWWIPVTAAIS